MDDIFLKETFLYGNLELAFCLRDIKKIPLQKLDFEGMEINISFIWRCYTNFRILFSVREGDMLNNVDQYRRILSLYKTYIDLGEKHYDIKDKFINTKPERDSDYFKISVYSTLSELGTRLRAQGIDSLIEIYDNLFYSYLPFIKNQNIILSYSSPFRDNIWKPRWKFIYGNDEIKLEMIDCYIDSYFYNPKFQYTPGMYKDIIPLKERILYLQENAPTYYGRCIVPVIGEVTRNIFFNYPLQIIFKEYLQIIDLDESIYRPDLYRVGNFRSDIGWMLCILPPFLSSYLLGYPVISCDVPSSENMKKGVEKIEKENLISYLEDVKKRNKTIISAYSFGVNISNGLDSETGGYVDLLFENVTDYNIDDTILFYNSKAAHIFTSPEFKDLSNKQINPYNNKTRIPMISRINQNLDFKIRIKRELRSRGIPLELDGTLQSNIEDIQHALKGQKVTEFQPRVVGYRNNARTLFERLGEFMNA